MSNTQPQPAAGFAWTQPNTGVGSVLQCEPLARHARHLFTSHDLELRGDAAEWQALGQVLGVPGPHIRLVRQVHRADVAIVRRGDPTAWVTPEADAIVTDDPEVAIGVRIADCAPILLADRTRPVVGAVHAGWRGTVLRAVQAGVAAMTREFGSHPADLVAAVGPCLDVCCGEVGDEVVEAFRAAGHAAPAIDRWFSIGPGGRFHLHLARANRDQLEAAGLPPEHIHVAGLCTRSDPEVFHSYRAAGPNAGRMAAVIRAQG
ncbi:MAG: peptidoglycan editing factor PgeF [Vicinamibacterales bacterium]